MRRRIRKWLHRKGVHALCSPSRDLEEAGREIMDALVERWNMSICVGIYDRKVPGGHISTFMDVEEAQRIAESSPQDTILFQIFKYNIDPSDGTNYGPSIKSKDG